MDPWTYEQREYEDQERFEEREREIEDASYAALIWHPGMSCGAFECVNACDGAPDYCAEARAALQNAQPSEAARAGTRVATGSALGGPKPAPISKGNRDE
jgi:hypothetical protein